ncbi:MAG TPA: hypothetical protein VJC16_06165 [Candidatus Nanoarchaeia archaeon]|nr:hypothetical protein [Candidatus Nanoarchaeia archaeon]
MVEMNIAEETFKRVETKDSIRKRVMAFADIEDEQMANEIARRWARL